MKTKARPRAALTALTLCLLLFLSTLSPAAPRPAAAQTDGEAQVALTPEEKEALLNAATLHPMYTGWAPMDTLTKQIFSKLFTDGMTVYEKVRAIFLYLMDGTQYVRGNETARSGTISTTRASGTATSSARPTAC